MGSGAKANCASRGVLVSWLLSLGVHDPGPRLHNTKIPTPLNLCTPKMPATKQADS